MRRVYYMRTKRQQIVQEAMLQMRAASQALGPEFMTRIRMLIKDCDPDDLSRLLAAQDSEQQPWNPADMPSASQAPPTEPVDKKKNLLIIMKFLQLKQDNKSVQTQVRTLLAETNTLQ